MSRQARVLRALVCSLSVHSLLCPPVGAQPAAVAELLLDINPTPPMFGAVSSFPVPLGEVGGKMLLRADHPAIGQELWSVTSSPGSATLVVDINPIGSGSPGEIVTLPSGVGLFFATDDAHGTELWRTDGTTLGTSLVKDIQPGPASSDARLGCVYQGDFHFFATVDGVTQLWKSDGTAAGTVATSVSVPSISVPNVRGMIASSSTLFVLHASQADHAVYAIQGTSAVKLLNLSGALFGPDWVLRGESLLFAANVAGLGRELWISDGTVGGTTLVLDIAPGSTSSMPSKLTNLNGLILFSAYTAAHGFELWRSDGTPVGTREVANINPGDSSVAMLTDMVVSGSVVLFPANDGSTGLELWRSDGTAPGTFRVADIAPGPGGSPPVELVDLGGVAVFRAVTPGLGLELWRSDGTAPGTFLVADIAPGTFSSQPHNIRAFGTHASFVAGTATGAEPWVTDGTPGGTHAAGNIAPDPQSVASNALGFTRFEDQLLFAANDGVSGSAPWSWRYGAAAPTLLKAVAVGSASGGFRALVTFEGRLFFVAKTFANGEELWATGGTPETTGLVKDIVPGPVGSLIGQAIVWGGVMYFTALGNAGQHWIWRSDGTGAGTVNVTDIINPGYLVGLGGHVYFTGLTDAFGYELWRTDGTEAGTQLVVDLVPGTASPSIGELTALDAVLLFRANGALWISDGQPAGSLLAVPGLTLPTTAHLTRAGDVVYLIGDDGVTGVELWKSDGTVAGTQRVVDLVPGVVGSSPADLLPVGDLLYFTAEVGAGRQIFVTDGTAAGTVQLTTGTAPPFDVGPPIALSGGPDVFFLGKDLEHGRELWTTDGTPSGTRLAVDLTPGLEDSVLTSVGSLGRLGDQIVVTPQNGIFPGEPHVFSLAALTGELLEPFGFGCEAELGGAGDPVVGGSIQITIETQAANAPGVLLLSPTPTSVPVGGGCDLYLTSPLFLALLTTDASGSRTLPLTIPNSPALIGGYAAMQTFVAVPGGPLSGTTAASNGLEILIGD